MRIQFIVDGSQVVHEVHFRFCTCSNMFPGLSNTKKLSKNPWSITAYQYL